jgi:hypothetical protein
MRIEMHYSGKFNPRQIYTFRWWYIIALSVPICCFVLYLFYNSINSEIHDLTTQVGRGDRHIALRLPPIDREMQEDIVLIGDELSNEPWVAVRSISAGLDKTRPIVVNRMILSSEQKQQFILMLNSWCQKKPEFQQAPVNVEFYEIAIRCDNTQWVFHHFRVTGAQLPIEFRELVKSLPSPHR